MKIIKLVTLVFSLILVSCATPRQAATSNDNVIAQLKEIKQEIKSLRLETSQLRTAVTEIHRGTVAAPTGQAVPQALVAEVKFSKDAPVLGDTKAKIGIIEYSDYQCPFCSRFYSQTLPKLKKTYIDTGKVVFIYRDFPLGFHKEAKSAAITANCAGKQDTYWQMHDRLFKNMRDLGDDLYQKLASELTLDKKKFAKCMQQPEQLDAINKQIAYAQTLGVSGTPTFFIGRIDNGKLVSAKRVTGAQPFSVFSQAINSIRDN